MPCGVLRDGRRKLARARARVRSEPRVRRREEAVDGSVHRLATRPTESPSAGSLRHSPLGIDVVGVLAPLVGHHRPFVGSGPAWKRGSPSERGQDSARQRVPNRGGSHPATRPSRDRRHAGRPACPRRGGGGDSSQDRRDGRTRPTPAFGARLERRARLRRPRSHRNRAPPVRGLISDSGRRSACVASDVAPDPRSSEARRAAERPPGRRVRKGGRNGQG